MLGRLNFPFDDASITVIKRFVASALSKSGCVVCHLSLQFLFLHEHVLSHQAIGGVREFFQNSYFPGKLQKLDPVFSEWGSSNYFEII